MTEDTADTVPTDVAGVILTGQIVTGVNDDGMKGVTVDLQQGGVSVLPNGSALPQTDDTGAYTFPVLTLKKGVYQVTPSVPAGYGIPRPGTDIKIKPGDAHTTKPVPDIEAVPLKTADPKPDISALTRDVLTACLDLIPQWERQGLDVRVKVMHTITDYLSAPPTALSEAVAAESSDDEQSEEKQEGEKPLYTSCSTCIYLYNYGPSPYYHNGTLLSQCMSTCT